MTGSGELVPLDTAEGATATIWDVIRMRPRTVLVTAALAIMTVGVTVSWSALVAAGIAPLLISALPCAVMCALGLCMSRMGKNSCATETAARQSTGAAPLQVDGALEGIEGPQLSLDLGRPSDREAAGADEAEQQQEWRSINA